MAALVGVLAGFLFIAIGVSMLVDRPGKWASRYADNLGRTWRGGVDARVYRLGLGVSFLAFGVLVIVVCSVALAS